MFTVDIDWDKAHKDTAEVVVDGCNVVEVTKENHWLRQHSVQGLMGGVSFKRPSEEPVPAKVQPAPAPLGVQPPLPAAAKPEFIKLNKYAFNTLLATIKEHATNTNVRDNAKLTHMQIHEQLLGLVEHD